MADEPKKGFTWEDADKTQAASPASGGKKPFTWADADASAGPDISSESAMAANPPVPKLASNPSHAAGTPTGAAPVMQQTAHPQAISVANQVTHPLQPNPHASANSPWFEQANGQQAGQPFSLNRLLDSPAGKAAHEANVNAAKFGADSMIGTNIVGPPLARIAESHVLPALKALPFAGKVVSAIDEAPGLIGKAARGATVGGVTGGTEGLIRGHGLAGSAKDAAEGAGFGAAAGLALPAIHKLSGVEPTVPERPAYGPETPTEGQFRRSAKIGSAQAAEAEAAKPVFPGASLPSASEFYENRGAELNKIRKMQPQEPPVEAEKPSFVGAPLPSAEDFYSNRGEDISRAMKQQPEAFTPTPKAEFPGAHLPDPSEFYENRGNELNKIRTMNEANDRRVARDAKANAPEPSPIVQPNAATPPSEGRPATWTNERVQELSSGGNPRTFQAANQAQLRQLDVPNVGLVADPQAATTPSIGRPRSVTRFDASGSPVETGRIASPISLGQGEDLGPGLGTQHTIEKGGNRVGSVTVEPKGEGNLHVHWLGGDLADNGVTRTHVVNSLKEQYPGTENITYDRRRLAKGDAAATTEPRSMKISGPGE